MALLTAAAVRTRISTGATPLTASDFPDTWVNDKVGDFEDLVRDYCGEEATTATTTEKIRNYSTGVALLRWPEVVSITSVTVSGSVLATDTYYEEHGIVRMESGCFTSEPTIVYVHGFNSPEGLKAACTIYVEKLAAAERSAQSRDNRDSRSTGDTSYFVMPSWEKRQPTGWTAVDAALNRYYRRLPGIA